MRAAAWEGEAAGALPQGPAPAPAHSLPQAPAAAFCVTAAANQRL